MRKSVMIGAAAVATTAGAAALIYLLLLRPRGEHEQAQPSSDEFPRWVRHFDRRVLNPLVLRVAGRQHSADYATLHHVGRRSGRAYSTPVVAHLIAGGFLIALPYGVDTDWCRNLQAAGHGTLQRQGRTYSVGEPEVIDAATAYSLLPPRVQRALRPFKIQHFLKLRQLSEVSAQEPPSPVTASVGRVVHG